MRHESTEGDWNRLYLVELTESPKLTEMLKPFSRPVANCYECGIEVPTLPRKRVLSAKDASDIHVAALFLKRALTDLRAIWNLLLLGYTSQAGSVAGTAFENALTVACVAGDAERANVLVKSKMGDSPWKADELCKMYVKKEMEEEARESGETFTENDFELRWREWYSSYVWLGRVKHPFMPVAVHDAFSVSPSKKQHILAVAPDVRPEDLPYKATILRIVIIDILAAIISFASAHDIDEDHPRVTSWKERLDSIIPDIVEAMKPLGGKRIPISIGDTRRMREYLEMRPPVSDES